MFFTSYAETMLAVALSPAAGTLHPSPTIEVTAAPSSPFKVHGAEGSEGTLDGDEHGGRRAYVLRRDDHDDVDLPTIFGF